MKMISSRVGLITRKSQRTIATFLHSPDSTLRLRLSETAEEPLSSLDVGPGQARVRVGACQVRWEDLMVLRGHALSPHRGNTGPAGSTSVGTVTSIGPGVMTVARGDSVLISGGAAWTSSGVFDASRLRKIPLGASGDGGLITLEQAAFLPSLVSAHRMLTGYSSLRRGDSFLLLEPGEIETYMRRAFRLVSDSLGLTMVLKAERGKKFGLCLTSSSSAALDCARSLQTDGTLVLYTGPPEPLDQVVGVAVPVSSAIFSGTRVCGFDYDAFSTATDYDTSLKAVVGLPSVHFGHVAPVSDWAKAVESKAVTIGAFLIFSS